MAVQVSVRSTGKVTFVGTTSCVKVGATAEMEGRKDGEVESRLSSKSTYSKLCSSLPASKHLKQPIAYLEQTK